MSVSHNPLTTLSSDQLLQEISKKGFFFSCKDDCKIDITKITMFSYSHHSTSRASNQGMIYYSWDDIRNHFMQFLKSKDNFLKLCTDKNLKCFISFSFILSGEINGESFNINFNDLGSILKFFKNHSIFTKYEIDIIIHDYNLSNINSIAESLSKNDLIEKNQLEHKKCMIL